MGLLPGCSTKSNNSFTAQTAYNPDSYCSLNIGGTAIFLANASQSIQVLNNVSSLTAVLTYEESAYTYLGIPPSDILSRRDYTATTYGMHTQCKPVTNECNMNAFAGAATPFSCTDAFSGDVTQAKNSWVMAYFTDSTMESNDTLNGIHNPYYFGIAAIVNPEGGGTLVATNETAIPEIGKFKFNPIPVSMIPLLRGAILPYTS